MTTQDRTLNKRAPAASHPVEQLLFLLSGHIAEFFVRTPSPHEFMLGVGYHHPDGSFRSCYCRIKIEASTMLFQPTTDLGPDVSENHRGPGLINVWDQVTVNGKSEGNRHGGAKAYANYMAPILIEAAQCGATAELTTESTIDIT